MRVRETVRRVFVCEGSRQVQYRSEWRSLAGFYREGRGNEKAPSISQSVGRKTQQCFGLRFCAPAATDAINFANA